MNLEKFQEIVFGTEKVNLSQNDWDNLSQSYTFLETFSEDKIIYGINTGFGPMAQFKIDSDKLEELQYNLIRSHSTGTGNTLSYEQARAVLVARLNNFLQGNSGVSPDVIRVLIDFLNNDIAPEIFEHGGVGASGDLVQLAQLGLNLIGEGFVYHNGERRDTSELLNALNIEPLKLQLRDGLGLINGTSCMTGIGMINLTNAQKVLNWTTICSASINEIMESFDDSISEELNRAKKHKGQQAIAQQMRSILADSQRMKNRVDYYKKDENRNQKQFEKKVQEYYSVRCVPQILGPVYDTLKNTEQVLVDELNSTNDNPIVDAFADGVFHGGNFHGDYVSLEMDKLKTVITKTTMLAERQLNFLLNPSLNGRFPAFLNSGTLGLNFGLQGAQFTATSTTAENQSLAFPNYVHSIPNNNDNQDIVSMGTNSALLTKKVIDNAIQVLSIHLIAVCKAMSFLSSTERSGLSSMSQMLYKDLEKHIQNVDNGLSLNEDIKAVQHYIRDKQINL